MAKPTTARPGKFIIMLGDGGSPEAFVAPCGFTDKSINWNRSLSEIDVPDCEDPDKPFWKERDVESLSCTVSGEGVLAAEAIPTWLAVLNTIEPVNVRVDIRYTGVAVLRVTGAMQLESFEVGGAKGQSVSINVTMQSHGEMVADWVIGA